MVDAKFLYYNSLQKLDLFKVLLVFIFRCEVNSCVKNYYYQKIRKLVKK